MVKIAGGVEEDLYHEFAASVAAAAAGDTDVAAADCPPGLQVPCRGIVDI
jgi:hypothetical protein